MLHKYVSILKPPPEVTGLIAYCNDTTVKKHGRDKSEADARQLFFAEPTLVIPPTPNTAAE